MSQYMILIYEDEAGYATATPEVREDIARQLDLRDAVTVITGFDRRNLHYHVEPTPNKAAERQALLAERNRIDARITELQQS